MTDYDPVFRLVRGGAYGTGYHTRLAADTPVHPLRESMHHALTLLDAEAPAGWTTAHDIIAAVLALQDTDPTHATYGIWPWFAEEPLTAMAPPDWNWADFIGAPLAELLIRRGGRLPGELAAAMRTALGHAAWSIFRRNVAPGYTNIAIMGAAVALTAGELLSEPRLVAYATARLRACAEYYTWVGGLTEYNSPTYTIIALEEAERTLRLGRDPQALAEAARLQRLAWETIAEHWHAPTGQWAGPHSRCYQNLVAPTTAALLAHKTGLGFAPADAVAPAWAVAGPPCPTDLHARFAAVVPGSIRRRFSRDDAHPQRDQWGSTWMDADACLGSISRDTTWTQRRPAIAYWRTAHGPACLRVRMLKDGKDFASGQVWTTQDGSRVLIGVTLVTDQGDWHCHLDRPATGAFAGTSLTLRIELTAPDARVVSDAGSYALHAGQRHARISPGPVIVDGNAATWTHGNTAGVAWVEAPLPVTWPLQPAAIAAFSACVGIELEPTTAAAIPAVTVTDATWQTATWHGLTVRWPRQPGPQVGPG